jgi:glycosyltransferase involved in cell wall biosynthesis
VQWFFFKDWERRYRLPFERIMRRAARRGGYRNFIVQSERMRAYFTALMPTARVWTLGCGVDDALFQPASPEGDYALFLGRLDMHHKGLDLLLSAWAQLRDAGVSIPLRIAGEGPGRAHLSQLIDALGLGACVTLIGRVEGARKHAILHGCAFVVMPSRQETFGLVAVEAMAAGKPVVAFDIDHLNELLRPEWGILAGDPDASRLAAAVAKLWQDPAARVALGTRGREAAQAHRWDAIARRQQEIYLEILRADHGK